MKFMSVQNRKKNYIFCVFPNHFNVRDETGELRQHPKDIIISFHLLLNGDTHFILEYHPAGWIILEYEVSITI